MVKFTNRLEFDFVRGWCPHQSLGIRIGEDTNRGQIGDAVCKTAPVVSTNDFKKFIKFPTFEFLIKS